MIGMLLRGIAGAWARQRMGSGARQDPDACLVNLLRTARNTRYGRQYGFDELLTAGDVYAAFRERLPIINYDAWVSWLGPLSPLEGARPLVDEAWPGVIDVFCLSSGTSSGRTKYVPYSKEMARINRKAALDFFAHMLKARPALAPPMSKAFYMTGSTTIERNSAGALCGDMSGLTKFLAPRFLETISLPPRSISGLEPWSVRLEALVNYIIDGPRIGTLSGIPIWQLTLLEALAEHSGRPPASVLPHLEFLIHGGMSMAPYRQKIKEYLPNTELLEVYAASETGITAFTLPGESGMRFWQQYQVFYEFEDQQGHIFNADSINAGVPYNLIVTNCSGLWRYRIGDVVVFKQTDPLILDFVTRDKTTSAFDEKVTEKELERAMERVRPAIADFSLGPDINARRHVWFLMTDQDPGGAWLQELDQFLRADNEDYDDYRSDGRINEPASVVVANRAEFLQAMGRQEGGQRKFPRLLSPEEVTRALDQFGQS